MSKIHTHGKYTTSRILRHLFCGIDHDHVDLMHVLLCAGVLAYIVYSGYMVFTKGQFEPLSYGSGFGAIMGGSGAGILAKHYTSYNNDSSDSNNFSDPIMR